jgi:PAS domain S-box-containing protein
MLFPKAIWKSSPVLPKFLRVCLICGRELEELRESEKLFRLLFERLADAVYITAFDGTILEANPAAEKQTGYSREELLGKNIMRDIAAEEPAMTYEKANELLARGETVVFEEKKRRKDGSFYWTECAVTQFTYKGQLATLSVNRDITERKKLEAELQRRVEELSALNQAVTVLTSQVERKKVVQTLVDLAKSLSGAEFANILLFDEEGNVLESIDPLGAPPLPMRLRPRGFTRLILETGKPLHIREIRPDGSTDPAVRDEEGQVIPANPVLVEAGIRSLAGFPLAHSGEAARGLLCAQPPTRRARGGFSRPFPFGRARRDRPGKRRTLRKARRRRGFLPHAL